MNITQCAQSGIAPSHDEYTMIGPGIDATLPQAVCKQVPTYEPLNLHNHDKFDIPQSYPLDIFWDTTDSNDRWTKAAKCVQGCWTTLLLKIPSKGELHFFEIYPDLSIKVYKIICEKPGNYDLMYRADTTGSHIVFAVINGTASDAAIMQVE
jgi:hypothetical protein